jgi:hypothetical protein
VKCTETDRQGFATLDFENDVIGVTVIPELGGNIASIRNLHTGREWLWRNPVLPYKELVYGGAYGQDYDVGGIDECFPTVDACTYPTEPWRGVAVPDHGELCWQAWTVNENRQGDGGEAVLAMSCCGVGLPFLFRRTMTIAADSPAIHLDYRVDNLSDSPMPFIWCIHPIMAIEPGMGIVFPENTTVKIASGVGGYPGTSGDTFTWPKMDFPGAAALDLARIPDPAVTGYEPIGVKLHTEALREGWAALRSADDKEGFRFTFDLEEIRHVAMWLNFGAWSGTDSPNYFNMGFEPAIGPCDHIDVAVRDKACAAEIAPKGTSSWSLGISLD